LFAGKGTIRPEVRKTLIRGLRDKRQKVKKRKRNHLIGKVVRAAKGAQLRFSGAKRTPQFSNRSESRKGGKRDPSPIIKERKIKPGEAPNPRRVVHKKRKVQLGIRGMRGNESPLPPNIKKEPNGGSTQGKQKKGKGRGIRDQ